MQLNGTGDQLKSEQYPLTTAEVIEKYGTVEIEHQNGSERLGDVLGRCDPETYESSTDLIFTIYAAMSEDAVGRKGYCDRDPTPPGVTPPTEPVSF